MRRDVLPSEQPAHVDGGRDRLDLFARSGQSEAVDALQDASFAPLDCVILLGGGVFEGTAQQQALHLHCQERLEDRGRIDV